MPKKKDANEFIKELYDIYGDSYDYSQVNYTGINNKVTLVCKTHDKFEAYPQRLLKGFGCTECTKERIRQEYETEFIMKSKEIYGDLYDYSLVHYVDFYTPVKIICKTHDVFEQSPRTHLKGTGCRQCYLESLSMNTDDFIKRSKEIHGDKFSYEHTVYVNEKTPVIITCKTHGDFEQIPEGHYRCEECCTQCRQEKLEQSFYDRAREVHNNFYSYDKVKFVSTHDDVIITCPVHGDFPQRLSHHLEGRGCPECSNDSFRKTLDEFIK